MKLVNLTPHTITFLDSDNLVWEELPPSGQVARLVLEQRVVEETPMPVLQAVITACEGLPEPQEGVRYVASMPVAQYASSLGRTDVYSPGEQVRDEQGRVIGCRALTLQQPSYSVPVLLEWAKRHYHNPVDFGVWLMRQLGYQIDMGYFYYDSLFLKVTTPDGETKEYGYGR